MSVLISNSSVFLAANTIAGNQAYYQKLKTLTIKGKIACAQKKDLLGFMVLQVLNREQIEVDTPTCNCLKDEYGLTQDCTPPPPPPPTKSIVLNSSVGTCTIDHFPAVTVDAEYENLSYPQNLSFQYYDGSSWIELFQIPISQASASISQTYSSLQLLTEGLLYGARLYSSVDDVQSSMQSLTAAYCTPTINLVTATASCAFGAIQIEAESYWWELQNDTILVEYFDGVFWQGLVNIGAGVSGIGGTSPSIPIGTGMTIPAGTYPVRFRALIAGTLSQTIDVTMGGC